MLLRFLGQQRPLNWLNELAKELIIMTICSYTPPCQKKKKTNPTQERFCMMIAVIRAVS